MLGRLFLYVFFSLFFTASSLAESPTKSVDQVKLDQTNEKILVLEKDLAIHKHTLQVSLESNDKRMSDFSILISKQSDHTTWIGILITVLLFLVGVFSYLNAAAKAKDVAQTEVDRWFESNAKRIKNKMLTMEQEVRELSDFFQRIKLILKTKEMSLIPRLMMEWLLLRLNENY